jgi:DHA3 family macrolide efflux protein-like MFS transporter
METQLQPNSSISEGWLKKFIPLWIGQAFSLVGSGLVQFALVWWLTEKTGSTAVLAAATLAALIPQVVVSPFAGALVDRWNRKAVMMIADSLTALATLVLSLLFATGAIQAWHVYALMFVRSFGGAFQWPAMQASTSLMVPEKHLSRLAGANQALNGLINIVAPPAGAFLLAVLPIHNVLMIDILTAILAVGILAFIAIPQPKVQPEQAASVKNVWEDVKTGLRYARTWPGLMGILVMAAMLNLFTNPAFSFIPLVVTRVFNGGALEYGWIDSAFGIGVVLGGLLLSIWGGFKRKIITSMLGLIGMGVGVLIVGLIPGWGYTFALAGMFLVGLMNPLVNGPLFAIIQIKVAPEMQGRIFTLVNSIASAMSPLGMVIASPVAEMLGLRSWYVLAGIACILMAAAGLIVPAINTVEEQTPGLAGATGIGASVSAD